MTVRELLQANDTTHDEVLIKFEDVGLDEHLKGSHEPVLYH